jgi:hypothetical protein
MAWIKEFWPGGALLWKLVVQHNAEQEFTDMSAFAVLNVAEL